MAARGQIHSLPQIAPVIGNAMSLEQGQKFLLESHLPVVRLLILDVLNGLVQQGDADTEGSVFALPAKEPVFREGVVHLNTQWK